MQVWISRIDTYSMKLYLRLVAFGTLIKKGRKLLHDPDVTKLMARRDRLTADLRRWFGEQRLARRSGSTAVAQ